MSDSCRVADATILVSTYNRPAALERVFEGLAAQSLHASQIIVGDDGSTHETATVIARWRDRGLPIEHCWHADEGFRKSLIMNRAIEATRARLAIFLDGDCVPLADFVRDHVAFHEAGHVLAGARILASKSYTERLEAGGVDIVGRGLAAWWLDRLRGRINRAAPLLRLPDGGWRRRAPARWQWVRGCNFSVATEALRRVDGFEEDITGWGLEDSELAVRLINAGLRVKSLRFAAPVIHLWHPESPRDRLAENDLRLQATMNEHRIRAERGISRHAAGGGATDPAQTQISTL
ncbi:MAG: glycosyltransferase [Burkholderiaceae bacterium]